MENEEKQEDIVFEEKQIVDTPKQNTSGNKSVAQAIIIAGVLIAGAILFKGSIVGNVKTTGSGGGIIIESTELEPISKEEHILGNPNAKIVIVEYSDLECPFCKIFHKTMQEIMATYKDVAWVYRHYPIPQLHAKAFEESLATECVWEQGGNSSFWQYLNKLFEITTSNDGLERSQLFSVAESLGVNIETFKSCLESEKYSEKIEANIYGGGKAGVRGTPKGFILKGNKLVDTIDGAIPINTLKSKLDKVLSQP